MPLKGYIRTREHTLRIINSKRGKHYPKISESKLKNPTRYWLGKRRPEMVGKGFLKGNIPWNKGKKIRSNTGRTLFKRGGNAGEKNPNWKGGITPIVLKIRHCFAYRQWRSDVFERDNYTCDDCNKRGGELEAHHIKDFSIILEENNIKKFEDSQNCEELWNINNGMTLCRGCHNKTKNKNVTSIKS